MDSEPDDLNAARAAIAGRGLTADASAHLTGTVAMNLPFEALGPFKNALKRFFSQQPWTPEDAAGLSAAVAEHIEEGSWWDHAVAPGLRIVHGRHGDDYVLWATGAEGGAVPSIFDRVFSGPVIPEATPHPRKVKFNTGGTAAPGRWYRRGDDLDDPRVADLLADGDVTDVMVAGDFVTIGLDRHSNWEQRLDPLLDRVTALFWSEELETSTVAARTRDELVAEGLAIGKSPDAAELHLLDPDEPSQRDILEQAAAGDNPRLRRIAVVTLAQSRHPSYVIDVLRAGYADESRIVRRAAIDAAGDVAAEGVRDLLEHALSDEDDWTRWKAVRALRDLGVGASREKIAALAEDHDFQVRMEVAAACGADQLRMAAAGARRQYGAMPRPFTADDLWAIRRVGQPEPAPDGSFVVVPVTDYDEDHPTGTTVLYVLRDGAEPLRLTSSEHSSSQPSVSPDGASIAFVRKVAGDEHAQLHVMPLGGGEATKLTDLPLGVADPRWLPDGSGLVFITELLRDALDVDGTAALLTERAAAPVQASVTEDRTYRYWDGWLTDGKVHHLFRLDLATGALTDLMPGTATRLHWNEPAGTWDISPDGAEIAYSAFAAYPVDDKAILALHTVPASGGQPALLTESRPADETRPRYSPDGRYLVYGMKKEWDYYADRVRLVRFDRETQEHVTLTEEWDRSASGWEFTPDAGTMVLSAEDESRVSLFTLPIVGGTPTMLVRGGVAHGPRPTSDGMVYHRIESIQRPPEVARTPLTGGDTTVVGHFNDELLDEVAMGATEEIYVPGADGAPIQTFVTYPPGFDPAKKWPLVHNIHGGPHGTADDSFHFRWNVQAFAAPGYVVTSINFHGSTSFGQDYATSIQGAWGEKPSTDVLAVTDHLVGQGWVDEDRMAIVGGSYGGYLVSWLTTVTDRFATAICHAGVTNLLGQYASDVTQGRARAMGADAWDDMDLINRWSPTQHTADMVTPTLVIHGEQDYRVVVTQGLELYGILKAKGVEARLVYYPDEGHWILKRHNSLHWYREFLGWLERFLK